MNEADMKRKKLYTILIMFFRVAMVSFFALQILGDFWNKDISGGAFLEISSFVLYLLTMLLLPVKRASIYVESLAIIGLLVYFGESALISLFVFPLATSMVGKVKVADMVFVPTLLFGIVFYAFGWNTISIAYSIGLFVFFFIKEYESITKEGELKGLKIKIQKGNEKLAEQEQEILSKDKEMEIVTSMFVNVQNLNKKINIEELMSDLVAAPTSFFKAEYTVLYSWDQEENKYFVAKEQGRKKRFNVPASISKKDGSETVLEYEYMRIPLILADTGENWGVLSAYGKKREIYQSAQKVSARFTEDDYERLAMYAEQVMFSVGHANLLNKFEEMATKDFLTGIPNRRRFFEQFDYLVKRANRGDELAVLVLDVDNFKKFNDTYGHDKGDEVLIAVSDVLDTYVREMDFVGRLGGEEFGVLIPNSNNQAPEIAERLRRKISIVPFVEKITISLGLAYYGEDGKTIEELYNNADKALYGAKETGKNKVVEFQELGEN